MASIRNSRAAAGSRLAARARGFTLIELVIVGVCVTLLAATAIASYEYATVKARRGNAQGCLIEAAQFMERYYTTNMTYAGAALPACSSDVTSHYDIGFSAAPTAAGFTIQAAPKGRQAVAETDCGTMTMDQVGRKTPAAGCW